jgi:UDP-N-acetylmuramate--alanine ligase
MTKSNIEIYRSKIKASHIYEIVDYKGASAIIGKRFHFIGAGGVGMSGLALLLMKNKAIVTGSDQSDGPVIEKLCQNGADIKIGHKPDNLSDKIDAVVISAAVKEDNPELALARKRGVKVRKYAQMLGDLMNHYDGIAVSGTHGKSTTSGWLTYCLKQLGIDTSFIIGADICQLGNSSGVGDSRFFVAEACEYDRSFLNLKPQIGCILNIEADHLDYYRDEEEIVDAFTNFALGIKPHGVLIAGGQNPNVAKVISRLPTGLKCETFGFNEDCNFTARNIQLIDRLNRFDIYHNGSFLGNAKISLPGKHNVSNALAVVAMAVNAGVKAQDIITVLDGFTGMDRRIMLKDKVNGITVLDDYAHHPTEIKASLDAIRQVYQPKRIWCIFQPHQYSRTRFLLDDFTESFKLADVTIVPEIYFVRDTEAEKKRVNSQILVDRIKAKGSNAIFIDGFGPICDYLKGNVTAGDVVVTMGAGNIWKVANEYIQWLRANN